MRTVLICPCLGFLFFVQASIAWAQPSILGQMIETEAAIVDVHAQNTVGYSTSPGQVAVDSQTGKMIFVRNVSQATYDRNGAGVIIHPQGIIVTNTHTIANANRIAVVLQDQTTFPVKVIRIVKGMDISLLRIEAPQPLPYVQIANSDTLQLGEEILTIGSSSLMRQTISGGKIIGLGVSRNLENTGIRRTDLIQTTVNLYQGDSGGPLFNQKGELIGMMTAKEMDADHSSFAVPSNRITEALKNYLKEFPETDTR